MEHQKEGLKNIDFTAPSFAKKQIYDEFEKIILSLANNLEESRKAFERLPLGDMNACLEVQTSLEL